MESKLQNLYVRMCACAVFRGALSRSVFPLFAAYCQTSGDTRGKISAYSAFVAEIYAQGGCLTELVKKLVFTDENV